MPIKKSKKEFEVKYIYRPSPDAEERLQKAFEALFKAIEKAQLKKGK